jgi:hypothetical protein
VARNKKLLEKDPDAKVNHHHANFLKQWWLLSWARGEMIECVTKLSRYISCSRVAKRPIFEFVSSAIRPNDACMVFPFADDYSFGVLQSGIHWAWFVAKCSTLTERFRYTSDTVFDTFPWPQTPSASEVKRVARAGRELRRLRQLHMTRAGLTLRQLYRLGELPGDNPLNAAQEELDRKVREAYGMPPKQNPLAFLLELNLELAACEEAGESIKAPGLPSTIKDETQFISDDCIRMV